MTQLSETPSRAKLVVLTRSLKANEILLIEGLATPEKKRVNSNQGSLGYISKSAGIRQISASAINDTLTQERAPNLYEVEPVFTAFI